MKRVTNCILREGNRVLLLQKPSRGWWAAPGGKMEPYETITESVIREYREETGLTLCDPSLRGVFTIVVESEQQVIEEWMMFTFFCEKYEGDLLKQSPEGDLSWIPVDEIKHLPAAEGDQSFLTAIAQGADLLVGRFRYTSEYQLLGIEMQGSYSKTASSFV